jgi:hypothetical protein
MLTQLIKSYIDLISTVGNQWIYPLIIGFFMLAVSTRVLIYFSVSRHQWFAYEFEKRVSRYLESGDRDPQPFYVLAKRLMERTFYELFEIRDRMKRRKPDTVMSMADRVFLIRQGSAWIVRDTLKQLMHLKWGERPNFENLTKVVFHKNPCFNRLLGLVSASGLNDVLNILPSVFVIIGIFGTFIGIMTELPTLSGIDVQDVEKTKKIMDEFVIKISFSMGTSVLGILFSVLMNFANTIFSPEKAFVGTIDRFENSLVLLWNRATSNEMPHDATSFDEHRDAVEALAEAALNQELARTKGLRDTDLPVAERQKQAS